MYESNIVIIGAGVIGLSIAYELSKELSDIIVVEKNNSFGQETSSRNSEVIHAGLYYPPESLKAKACLKGRQLLYEFCRKYNIPHKQIGKLVVACDDKETSRIEEIYENACRCGIENLQWLKRTQIEKLEPYLSARSGFFSPDSGIIDTHSLMHVLYHKAKGNGTSFAFSTQAIAIDKQGNRYLVTVKESSGDIFTFKSTLVINAAGLYADKVARMPGIDVEACGYNIYYCKGQYFRMKQSKKFSIAHLVYPPATSTSLGIHITLDLSNGLRLGPDAKYIPRIDYSLSEGDKRHFYESVKKFLPALQLDDLSPDTAGVRPKLQNEGEGFRDFVIVDEAKRGFPGFINCIGMESPGLTSCLEIAQNLKRILKTALS